MKLLIYAALTAVNVLTLLFFMKNAIWVQTSSGFAFGVVP